MNNAEFRARRTTRTYSQIINAAPEKVFPLLCPVREAEWLDGWQCAMIYSESGLVEEGAVFRTPHSGEEDTVWVVTEHDPEKREVEFARFTHDSRTCMLRIAVRARAENSSSVEISYTYTATTLERAWFGTIVNGLGARAAVVGCKKSREFSKNASWPLITLTPVPLSRQRARGEENMGERHNLNWKHPSPNPCARGHSSVSLSGPLPPGGEERRKSRGGS